MLPVNMNLTSAFYLLTTSVRHHRVCTVAKRGSMLSKMVENTDKRKRWHFHILQNTPKARNVFEKVSRPSKRQSVLNSLFIRNITDVISTGDVAPEVLKFGIEITGVKIAPCCKMLNVYWQIPSNKNCEDENISTTLNMKAASIRAELISRNVMGRIPHIHFIRDTANAYMAAFEKAMQEADMGPEEERAIVPDDSFLKKKKGMYKFTEPQTELEAEEELRKKMAKKAQAKPTLPPPRPPDMKNDVFGLNHDKFMDQVMKQKSAKPNPSSHVISPNQIGDLFSRIPGGEPLRDDPDRAKLLKQFRVERRMLLEEQKRKAPSLEYEEDGSFEENDYCDVEDDFDEEDKEFR